VDRPRGRPTAEFALQRFGVAAEETPVVIVRDDIVLRNPSTDDLAEEWACATRHRRL
jgi:hypothetical protein